MVEYATLSDLRAWGTEYLAEQGEVVLKRAKERSPSGSTFLSHSSKDADYLPGVIRILNNHGATVYVDKKDETLPPFTNHTTAKTLRKKIDECRKFILFATTNSKDSKWAPWELGLSDGYKRPMNTAIFPGLDKVYETKWTEQEYLGIYDRIVWGDLEGHEKKVWFVWNREKNTGTELSRWLAR